ncbi:MAG: hypothetical protein BRC46_01290 [Cyanobacteria bacterium QS_6_48_18]|nr:MAG: hypothetical protein BRC46_01290 [Cyanobacteria bacterium QS_6_48_18]
MVGQPLCGVDPYEIECSTSVEVSLLPPHLRHQVFDAILSHARQTEELLSMVSCGRLHQRLLQTLGWLPQKIGRPLEQGQLIELRLTHQEIAKVIVRSRLTMTRLLKQSSLFGSHDST